MEELVAFFLICVLAFCVCLIIDDSCEISPTQYQEIIQIYENNPKLQPLITQKFSKDNSIQKQEYRKIMQRYQEMKSPSPKSQLETIIKKDDVPYQTTP